MGQYKAVVFEGEDLQEIAAGVNKFFKEHFGADRRDVGIKVHNLLFVPEKKKYSLLLIYYPGVEHY